MKYDIPVEKNKTYEMDITDLGKGGEGIGRIKEFAIFVEDAVPGDHIEVLIIKVKNRYAYGKLMKVLNPSVYRTQPLCPVANKCGGCQLQHVTYEGQLCFKTKMVKDDLERIGGLEDVTVLSTIGMSEPFHYRNKAQFPVGEKDGVLQTGFYAKRTHRIVDTKKCWIQNKVNERILEIVRTFMEEEHISPYAEKSHKGLVRHILTRVGYTTGEIMFCLVLNGKKLPYAEKLVEKLLQVEGMTSIVLNENRSQTNVILGEKTQVLWGKGFITDYIGEIKFEISLLSFYQVNPVQTRVLYEKALELADLQGHETVLDIYCGIGTISLFFAQKAKKVFGVEIVPDAIEDARRNAEINGIQNAEFFVGAAEDVIPKLYDEKGITPDVVVVDPPRKGCDEGVLRTIIEMKPQKVVYVSCDPATLARDLGILCENGFEVQIVQPVDQFPMTTHVECVVRIQKIQ